MKSSRGVAAPGRALALFRRQPILRLTIAMVVVVLAGWVPVPVALSQDAAAQQPYEPCQDSDPEAGIDLLLLMDQSTSLQTADPNRKRREALELIRHELQGHERVRVALLGFNNQLHRHAPTFAPASTAHPSDSAIAAASDARGTTDYEVALDAAIEAFSARPAGSCRVLVWFTDGFHELLVNNNAQNRENAEALRDDVCGSAGSSQKRTLQENERFRNWASRRLR